MKTTCISVVLVIISYISSSLDAGNAARIQPYKANPRYWQYKGEPILLLGGSATDHIFLHEPLKAHLNEMPPVGANYVRCTMSQREGLDLKPHKRLPDGKFDLDQWNKDYWLRFENCLEWCLERDIIVQIEVWDRFDFSQQHWQTSPWRPVNNVNYTNPQTALANNYPAPAYRDRQPFFHTIPGMPLYKKQLDLVRRHQEEFVDKILSYSLDFPNVLYCMNNETSTPPAWGRYWIEYIKRAAAEEDVQVCTTDMFDDGWKPQKSAKIRQAFENPAAYTFIDVSQVNSRTFNEDHWTNIRWLTKVNDSSNNPRPLNCTKIYSDGQTRWGSGTPVDGVERFWRNLIAGTASCRFHRPGAGIGLNDIAKSCIEAARKIESLVKFWQVRPRLDLLSDRSPDEAYLAADHGQKYILFFTDGGSVVLDLTQIEGRFSLKWVNIGTGNFQGRTTLEAGKKARITAPAAGPFAAAVVKD